MTVFILASEVTSASHRAIFDTTDPADDRLGDFLHLVSESGISPLSTTHQMHAIAGPEHPHFGAALAAYKLTHYPPCDHKIVHRAMELLVAGELLQPEQVDDESLFTLISIGFATEYDWEERGRSAEIVVRSYLSQHFTGFENPHDLGRDQLTTYAALTGGLLVAISEARAEWRP